MTTRDAVVAALDGSEEKAVRGRTALQKRVYLAAAMCGIELPYQPHFYGPYSKDLATSVDRLVDYGMVRETLESVGPSNSRLHVYALGGDTKQVIDDTRSRVDSEHAGTWERFQQAVGRIERLGTGYQVLSYAAKIHWVLVESGRPLDGESIQQRVRELNWELTDDELQQAVGILLDLGLAVQAPVAQGA